MKTFVVVAMINPRMPGMTKRKHIELKTEKYSVSGGFLSDKKTGKILGQINQVYSE